MNYSLFIILATIFYGLNVNLVSRYLKHIPSLSIAAVAFSVLTIPAGLILFFFYRLFSFSLLPPDLFHRRGIFSAFLELP